MLDLGLAVGCSVATAMLLKLVEVRRLDRVAVLAVNYVVATGLALTLLAGGPAGLPPAATALGVGTGALFLAGFYSFGAAIKSAGVGIATGVMRLSVAVPVVGSWALFADAPTLAQGGGLVLAGAAFFLMARPAEASAGEGRPALVLVTLALLFAVGGAVDLAISVYARVFGASTSDAGYLSVVFGAAAILACTLTLQRLGAGSRPGRREVAAGLAVGIANYGSAAFLVRAAGALPAPIVFPTAAIGIMAGAALLAVVLWRERLSRANGAGLALAAGALGLLWGGAGAGR